MSVSTPPFFDLIDREHDAARSAVLRYCHALRFESDPDRNARLMELLERCSVREGLRVVPLMSYRGVEIHVLSPVEAMTLLLSRLKKTNSNPEFLLTFKD